MEVTLVFLMPLAVQFQEPLQHLLQQQLAQHQQLEHHPPEFVQEQTLHSRPVPI